MTYCCQDKLGMVYTTLLSSFQGRDNLNKIGTSNWVSRPSGSYNSVPTISGAGRWGFRWWNLRCAKRKVRSEYGIRLQTFGNQNGAWKCMDNSKSVLLPGQSSQSPTNAPALDHKPVPAVAGPSTLQPENHKAVQSAAAPSTLLPEFHETVPSAARPSTLLPEEDSSEPIDIDWDNDDTDSSSDESMPCEELEMEEKIQRRLAFYQEMFDKSSEQHMEERAEGTRKRKAEDLTRGKPLQMELEHHHDYIKKCFKKGMEEANMQGYVYGIVLHDNKVLSGSSESLRKWCDQTTVFEHVIGLTGPPDGPLSPSQPNISIPQASELQQSASHEVQTIPASAEPNQSANGNSDWGPDSPFFQ